MYSGDFNTIQYFQFKEATQWFLNVVYVICCKKMIMQALVIRFGNDVGTFFFYVCTDFGEYPLIRVVVNGL